MHADFQATITLVAYPALVAAPAASWGQVHAAHSRRITPLVAVVHGAVLAARVRVLTAGGTGAPSGSTACGWCAHCCPSGVRRSFGGGIGRSRQGPRRCCLRAGRRRPRGS
ncbi:hypothetical protein GCM10009528_24720 [Kineococcus aurantiacus]